MSMLKLKMWKLLALCDAEGCEARASETAVEQNSALGELRKRGWSVGRRILCPEHRPRPKKEAKRDV